MARGAAERGKRVAFGDKRRIIWAKPCYEVFKNNPNVAPPGAEGAPDLEWVAHYPGSRIYHLKPPHSGGKWRFNYDFRPTPGEIYFDDAEKAFAGAISAGFVLIEPRVKPRAQNKQWGIEKWRALAAALRESGHDVVQFNKEGAIPEARIIKVPSFRHAMAAMTRARLCILPEGGLHHGAAAVNLPGIVLFGGFTPPELTGYDMHSNIFTGGTACGSQQPCAHCRDAMDRITVQTVYNEAQRMLG